MATNVFDAQVKAVDEASGPIRKMLEGMKALVQAARGVSEESKKAAHGAARAGTEAGNAIKHAADEAEASHVRYFRTIGAHIHLLSGSFGELNATLGEVGKSFTEFLPALGALGAGATLVGLVEMTKDAAEATLQFDALTQKLGVTAKELVGLNWAAKESGVGTETMQAGVEKLNRTMGLVVGGKAKDVAALFHHLGWTTQQIAEAAKDPAKALPELADAFSKTSDPAIRARMAVALFGKAGQELIPLLLKGREALEEMQAAGLKFAYLANPEQKAGLLSLAHGMEELDASTEGFKREIAANLAPILAPIVHTMTEWILANRDWIATGIANKVRALADALTPMAHLINDVLDGTTTWGNALQTTASHHYGLVAAVGALGLALSSPLFIAVAGAITILTTLSEVMKGLTLVAWANPWIIAAAALAVAAYEIYQHWEPIKQFFVDLWKSISDAFSNGWDYIQPIIDKLKGAVDWVRNSELAHLLGLDPTARAAAAHAGPGPNIHGRPAFTLPPGALLGPLPQGDGSGALVQQPNGAAPYQSGSLLQQPIQQTGTVYTRIDISGAPPGTKVQTDAAGIAQPPDTSVGYINPLGFQF